MLEAGPPSTPRLEEGLARQERVRYILISGLLPGSRPLVDEPSFVAGQYTFVNGEP